MLHTNQSKKKNVWKYAFILPVLVGFMLLFQVETVAQVKENINTSAKVDKVTVEAILYFTDKNATDTEMKADSEELKKQGIEYKFSKIKRNKNGEIIAIKIEFDDNKGTTGIKEIKGKEPIEPIYFSAEKNKLGFTNAPDLSDYVVDEKLSEKFGTELKVKKINEFGSSNFEFKEINKSANSASDKLYIINGEEYLQSELSKMNIISAEKINVLYNEKAIEKYGDKGKNGVIIIEGNFSFEKDGETVSFEEPKGTITNEMELYKKEKELKAKQNSKLSIEQSVSLNERRTNMELARKERESKVQKNSNVRKEEIEDRIEKRKNINENNFKFTTIIETDNGNQTVVYDLNRLKIPGSPSVKIDKSGPSIYVNGKILADPEAFLKMDPKQIYYIEVTDQSQAENGVITIKRIDVKTK